MTGHEASWGLVATIKAPARDVLAFAAHHIELGAHRLYIFLDAPNPAAFSPLKAHPKVRVFTCDSDHWARLGRQRPAKHQTRQTYNATFAYGRRPQVTWLAHIDVDEFLWPGTPLGPMLAAQPDSVHCLRVRPVEALAGGGNLFKEYVPAGPDRDRIVEAIYPTYGAFVKGGFLSHVAGKLLVRTGLDDGEFRIHNFFHRGVSNPGAGELDDVRLCHCHAPDWDSWIAAYRYRIARGSYRADLAPNRPVEAGGLTMHELLQGIEQAEGPDGLRAFYDEMHGVRPEVRAALHRHGLLRHHDLQLERLIEKHFGQ